MTFLARILRFVFWLLIVSWSVAILRRIVNNMGRGARNPENRPVDVPTDAVTRKLVRDPVCGMHMAEVLAIPLRQSGEILHFCSLECRDKYLSKTQKFAANG
jgi:YHS domain-containing protein